MIKDLPLVFQLDTLKVSFVQLTEENCFYVEVKVKCISTPMVRNYFDLDMKMVALVKKRWRIFGHALVGSVFMKIQEMVNCF